MSSDTGDHVEEFKEYREGEKEQLRAKDLMRIVPKGLSSVLDVGARDGFYSALLADYFQEVFALDLEHPTFKIKKVINLQGDIRHLDFPDNSFDCVFCAEVLEHVSEIEDAVREISRVAKGYVVIGVPYKQDIRIGRAICYKCGKINPPWGHVNVFDEKSLRDLFANLIPVETSFLGTNRERTNALSTWLMDQARNPWGAPGHLGAYTQTEPCIFCGAKFSPRPGGAAFHQKVLSGLAHRLNLIQNLFIEPRPNWIHILFRKAAGNKQ